MDGGPIRTESGEITNGPSDDEIIPRVSKEALAAHLSSPPWSPAGMEITVGNALIVRVARLDLRERARIQMPRRLDSKGLRAKLNAKGSTKHVPQNIARNGRIWASWSRAPASILLTPDVPPPPLLAGI